jgi:2-oxopent-4-enoate hydratase
VAIPDDARLRAHAEALRRAELTRRPIAPLTGADPGLTAADAYAIQRLNAARRVEDGGVVRGRKIGLTSRPMQRLLGVNEPDFGVLFADMVLEDGDPVSLDQLIQPKAEAEIAFLLRERLAGPGVTSAGALQAVAGVLAAIEIIDSRIEGWKITLVDTIADNASSARVVVGGRVIAADALDLRLVGVVARRNGEVLETGAGAAALGNPLRCLAWLANKLAEGGEALQPGDLVLSGALHRAFDIAPNDVITVEVSGLGTVSTHVRG